MADDLKRVMLVEDDEHIAFVTVMSLEEIGGFEVRHFDGGQAALNGFDSFAPQIVLMDVMMPEMDGPETLSRLRQNPKAKDVPVVFMTAKAQTHEVKSYLEMGATGVIIKPFDPMTLCDHVRDFWTEATTA